MSRMITWQAEGEFMWACTSCGNEAIIMCEICNRAKCIECYFTKCVD